MFLVHTSVDHAEILARAVVAACRGQAWRSPVQPALLHTLFNRLLGKDFDFDTLTPMEVDDVRERLLRADERKELVQLMVAVDVLANPIPVERERSVALWASRLDVEERSLVYLRDLAAKETAKSLLDFYRLNWIGELDRRNPNFEALLERAGTAAYGTTVEPDPAEAARWRALVNCPAGSLGRGLADFYDMRGFTVPGEPGAVNAAIAHHDWVHVLSDYGTTPLGELEVLSFQSAGSRTPGAFLGLVGAIALFESGLMPRSMIVETQPGHVLSERGATERVAEATARGAAVNTDLIGVDFFELADESLESLRSRFAIPAKSKEIIDLDPYGAFQVPPVP